MGHLVLVEAPICGSHDTSTACSSTRFALNLRPDNPVGFLKLAKLHVILGELEDALR
jgi:hypothetical protein